MKLRYTLLLLLACAVSITSLAQDSVDLVTYWKKGDAQSVKFTMTTIDNTKGSTENYVSTYDAKFKVLEENADGSYKVEWTYTGTKLAENDPTLENQVLSRMMNTKFLLKITDIGQYGELLNASEIIPIANKAVDELIAASAGNQTLNIQYKGVKQFLTSKQSAEIFLLKQIKFYHLHFGYNYKLNFVQNNELKIANALGGQPFDALEKVKLTSLDPKTKLCTIETSKTVDGAAVRTAVTGYIKKLNAPPSAVEEIAKAQLEISESSSQTLDYEKGFVKKGMFKRIVNLGIQNRTTITEISAGN